MKTPIPEREDVGGFGVALALICGLALLLHFEYSSRHKGITTIDSREYIRLARQLAEGRAVTALVSDSANGEAETVRTPGYPLFLYALGIKLDRVVLVQHVLCIAVAAALGVFLRGRAGLLAAALIAFDTATIVNANVVMTETLFMSVLVAAAMAMMAAIRHASMALALVAGVFAGAAPMVRPIAIGVALPLVAAAIIFARRRRAMIVLAFLVPAVALPVAWIARNASGTGVTTFSSIAGGSMLYWRAAGALSTNQREFFQEQKRLHRPELTSLALQGQIDERRGLAIVASHPLGVARSAIVGSAYMIFAPPVDFAMQMSGGVQRDLLLAALTLVRLAVVGLAAFGLVILARHDPLLLAIAGGLLAYLIIMSAGPEGIYMTERFRTPMVPFESIAAAIGAAWLAGERRLNRSRWNPETIPVAS
jgi:hypothetical protein